MKRMRRLPRRLIKVGLWLWLVIGLVGAGGMPAFSQDETTPDEPALELSLRRDFGYGGLGGDIQGTFSYRVSGPDNLERVEFLLDGQVIGEDSEPPFRLQFNTGSYALGPHTLSAMGYTADGRVLQSNAIQRNFVDPSESWSAAARIVGPVLAIVLLAVLVPALISIYSSKRNPVPPGAPRKYGLLGGAICPHCGRPFGIHFWSINLGGARLDRCPHCGKWHRVRRADKAALRAAEQAELEKPEGGLEESLSEEEKLRRLLDESRYDEL